MQRISATDLARNTSKILDKVVIQGQTVAIERNHVLVARLMPYEPNMTAAEALDGLKPMLTDRQGADWLKDSREEFDQAARDPWE